MYVTLKNSRIHPPLRKLAILLLLALLPVMQLLAQSPEVALGTVTNASNGFGFQLYQRMIAGKTSKNQFMSPFSVFAALAMTSEGAAGSTLEALQHTLGLPDEKTLHAGFQQLELALHRKDAPYALALANAIWPEKTAPLRPEFLATIQKVYLGGSTPLDFQHNSELARKTINDWVMKRTNNRIKDLLPPGSVDASTAIVLTNAIFFKGKWLTEFKKELTEQQPFFLASGDQVQAPLMYLPADDDQYLPYAEMDGYQALQLPYKGDDLSMVILLPKMGTMERFEKGLDAQQWAQITKTLQYNKTNVWLPRFKMELGGSIRKELIDLGLAPLFGGANFSRMFSSGSFAVSDVIHKAFVEVNEEGTEAAAATAVVVKATSVAPDFRPTMNFRADHPFMFMIQHNASHSILFMGKVMNPVG